MNRMVEEQRTQIGVLKALGYSERTIMAKYMFYSGSAAVSGCIIGFFWGTWFFPKVIWYAYGMMYQMDTLVYLFDWKMAVISLVVSLLCSVGTTWICCRYELTEVAAELMRPKAPKAGKRVIFEYIPFLWKRLKFLQKVAVRNVFRYKKRFFMMVLGISGCSALLLTGFGIMDSITNVANQQFKEIQTYDLSVTTMNPVDDKLLQELDAIEGVDIYACIMEKSVDLKIDGKQKSIDMEVLDADTDMTPFLNLHTTAKESIAYPGKNEAVIANKIAEEYGIKVGDVVTLVDDDQKTMEVTITGICQNFIYNYIYVNRETYEEQMGEKVACKAVWLNKTQEQDAHLLSTVLMNTDGVAAVTVISYTLERFSATMESMNLIVVVIIFCAAGLAFIVLYNLTNINITERVREIATIKVLGFYEKETASYVFRENTVLTFLGALVGLVLGYFLHSYVMSQINIDLIAFDVHITPRSYVYSVVLTMVFAWLVNQMMKKKIDRISMTESLKSVD
jgi:putative ABC transport system permease protein